MKFEFTQISEVWVYFLNHLVEKNQLKMRRCVISYQLKRSYFHFLILRVQYLEDNGIEDVSDVSKHRDFIADFITIIFLFAYIKSYYKYHLLHDLSFIWGFIWITTIISYPIHETEIKTFFKYEWSREVL